MKEARFDLSEEAIAEITIDPKAKRIRKTSYHAGRLKFKCQRCGVFCCKLGSPRLSRNDANRLRQAGYVTNEFFEVDRRNLQSRADGSCIFLSIDTSTQLYKCSIYSLRPILCRLYPFQFEKIRRNLFYLRVIPCCKGLNTEDGENIDMNFVNKTAHEILLELIGTDLI